MIHNSLQTSMLFTQYKLSLITQIPRSFFRRMLKRILRFSTIIRRKKLFHITTKNPTIILKKINRPNDTNRDVFWACPHQLNNCRRRWSRKFEIKKTRRRSKHPVVDISVPSRWTFVKTYNYGWIFKTPFDSHFLHFVCTQVQTEAICRLTTFNF